MHLGNPWPVINAYRKAGFDCIALTEHANQTNLSVEKETAEKAEIKFKGNFFVIPGKENTARTFINGNLVTNDIVSLFLDRDVSSYDKAGNVRTHQDHIKDIRDAGGIAVIAHEHSTEPSCISKRRLWNYRNDFRIDGWEIGHGLGLLKFGDGKDTSLHCNPEKVIKEGYISIADSDSHADFQAFSLGESCHTYIFLKEKTLLGIKKALEARQTVSYVNGFIYGPKKWRDLYCQWRLRKDGNVLQKHKESVKTLPVPSIGKMFILGSETERLDFIENIKRYYQTASFSHKYFLSEHALLSLFCIINPISDSLRAKIREAASWLSFRYYWITEYHFQNRKRQELLKIEAAGDKSSEKNPAYWTRAARLHYLIQEPRESLQAYQKAETLDAKSENFFVGYSQLLFRDNPAKTLEVCARGLKLYPGNLFLAAQAEIAERLTGSAANKNQA